MYAAALIALLRAPGSVGGLREADWHAIIEAGRKTQTLGQLAALLKSQGLMPLVPAAVGRHLDLALLTSVRRNQSALWEIGVIRRSVDASIPVVLLKGCAYAACGDHNAQGRVFSDVDVLVARRHLPTVEAALYSAGWKPSRVSDYDAAYYRAWLHEVPAMEHVRRHTVVDLHHAINPPVSRFHIDPALLMAQLVEISPGIFVLGPTDRVLHCCMHLLQEGEPKKLLRDLWDLHLLVAQHFPDSNSQQKLFQRARESNVLHLVRTAIGAAYSLFGSEGRTVSGSPGLRSCIVRSAREANGKTQSLVAALAGTWVLAHSHWMKMPLHLLVPHLLRKSYLHLVPERDKNS